MNQVKQLDDIEAMIFMSGIYEKVFQREAINYNILYSDQNKQINDNNTVAPEMITFNIPNSNLINVADTYMSFKMAVGTGVMKDTDFVF